jgi:colicin import membrane protein
VSAFPVATALGRRDRIWPAVLGSAVVHAALVAVIAWNAPPTIDLQQRPIVAKLVRLGEKKPQEYLPRKEAPPPPPAPAAPAPVAISAPAPVAPAAPVAGAKPAPKPPPAAAPARSAPSSTGTSVASILSRVNKQVAEQRWGAPDGDPAGDSEDAGEGDRYLALVVRSLQANYRVPVTISERERMFLKGTVVLFIDADGRIASFRLERSSGNGAFDDALERTVRQTRLPPPPDEVRGLYRSTGLAVIFQIG